MRIESTPKQTPDLGSPLRGPADSLERFVWEELAPRLLHPSKLAFIRALLQQGRPLTPGELANAAEVTEAQAEYQCESMQRAGVLEVVGVVGRADGEEGESAYFFPRSTPA